MKALPQPITKMRDFAMVFRNTSALGSDPKVGNDGKGFGDKKRSKSDLSCSEIEVCVRIFAISVLFYSLRIENIALSI